VNVYSLRARAQPTVSAPVTWEEVNTVAEKGEATRLVFNSAAALQRVERHGDLFGALLTLKQRLPTLRAIAI
jgi:bifunctional non-homologous end joining protein LigD